MWMDICSRVFYFDLDHSAAWSLRQNVVQHVSKLLILLISVRVSPKPSTMGRGGWKGETWKVSIYICMSFDIMMSYPTNVVPGTWCHVFFYCILPEQGVILSGNLPAGMKTTSWLIEYCCYLIPYLTRWNRQESWQQQCDRSSWE